jgi:CCR4-NOT transcription complex subunit 1
MIVNFVFVNHLARTTQVLLHDFPEFLSDYHFSLCDAIPATCVQMRNLVLSAFPRNMRLPDPFTPNLKVDLLPEIAQPPRMLSNHMPALLGAQQGQLAQELNGYLNTRQPEAFVASLAARCARVSSDHASSVDVNAPSLAALLSALTLHVAQSGIAVLAAERVITAVDTHRAHLF